MDPPHLVGMPPPEGEGAGAQINHDDRQIQVCTTARTITTGGGAGQNLGRVVSFNARVLVWECLKFVGRELGVSR